MPWSGIVNIVGGAPRGGRRTEGLVLITRFNPAARGQKFTFLDKIVNPDPQIGSYFGGAVCVVDVNGDGKDDVLVSAPYHDQGSAFSFYFLLFQGEIGSSKYLMKQIRNCRH